MNFGVFIHGRAWHWDDLARAAHFRHSLERLDLRTCLARLDTRTIQIQSGRSVDLDQFDAILVLGVPGGSLEQVIFRMDALGVLSAAGIPVVNPPKAIETCVDKFLTLARLRSAGLPVPATHVCQTALQALECLGHLGDRAVCKPIFGSEGKGIELIDDKTIAAKVFDQMEQMGQVIYLQEFIQHSGWDLRLLVIGDRVYAMRRENRNDWRTNAFRGAVTTRHNPTVHEVETALASAQAVEARIAGVDLVYDECGRPLVLEVNSAPGWKHLSQTIQVDIAAAVLDELEHSAKNRQLIQGK